MNRIDNYRVAARDLHNLEHRSSGALKVRMQRCQQGQREFKHSTDIELPEGSPALAAFIEAFRCWVAALRVEAEKEARELLAEEGK